MADLPELYDTIEIEDGTVRKTRDGYLVASARVARTGVQKYFARELDLKDRDPNAIVRVYRPPAEVFAADAMNSIAWRPMTNDHPKSKVTAANWKKLSIGNVGDQVVRDGSYVRVPLTLMDQDAITAFDAGKRELSIGYGCEIEMTDGVVPADENDAGQAYDAVQHNIRANHIALCDRARGGDKLRIGDGMPTLETQPEPPKMATYMFDGLLIPDVSDSAKAVIEKLQGQLQTSQTALTAADAKVAEHVATIATKDGEIVGLKATLKDAEVTPERLAKMVADRAALVTAAKPILGDAYDFSGKTDAEIRKAAVVKKVGDSAATMEDAAITGAFSVLAASVKDTGASRRDPVREVIGDGGGHGEKTPRELRDAAKAKRLDGMRDAYLDEEEAA